MNTIEYEKKQNKTKDGYKKPTYQVCFPSKPVQFKAASCSTPPHFLANQSMLTLDPFKPYNNSQLPHILLTSSLLYH